MTTVAIHRPPAPQTTVGSSHDHATLPHEGQFDDVNGKEACLRRNRSCGHLLFRGLRSLFWLLGWVWGPAAP